MLKIVISKIVMPCLILSSAVAATDSEHPQKMSKEEIAGAIFKDKRLVVHTYQGEAGPYETEDVETFLSSDRKFDSGMYRSGAVRMTLDPYGVDEFMYFLEGGVTLTSKDGTVTEIKAGDAVTIGKEWQGTWDTKGYTKIYVIYSPTPMTGE
ncbi:MAG: DUF861 domain-containing protein [Alphaproteobacteria bacterium]|nr:DUF861 domain-containing protein [Alphaproteobacteria bacterium]